MNRYISNLRKLALGLALAVLASSCIVPSSTATYTVSVESDVVYGQGVVDGGNATMDLLADLYIPDTAPGHRRPLMILIHGGGFYNGSKSQNNMVNQANWYAARGYLVASIDYRLVGDNPIPSARMDPLYNAVGGANAPALVRTIVAALDDTISALEFLQARDDVVAEWTTLWGSSAGAVTSVMTAYILDDYGISRPPVAAVVDNWGGLYGLGVGNPFDDPANDPALFIVHGTNDTVVPYSLTEDIVALLAEAGGPVSEVYPIEGAGHGMNLFGVEASPGVSLQQRTLEFIAENVYRDLPEGPFGDCEFNPAC